MKKRALNKLGVIEKIHAPIKSRANYKKDAQNNDPGYKCDPSSSAI